MLWTTGASSSENFLRTHAGILSAPVALLALSLFRVTLTCQTLGSLGGWSGRPSGWMFGNKGCDYPMVWWMHPVNFQPLRTNFQSSGPVDSNLLRYTDNIKAWIIWLGYWSGCLQFCLHSISSFAFVTIVMTLWRRFWYFSVSPLMKARCLSLITDFTLGVIRGVCHWGACGFSLLVASRQEWSLKSWWV